MKASNDTFPWLELIDNPAFCVKDGAVIAVNTAAEKRTLRIGTDIHEIITAHQAEYETFQNGELYLTVAIGGLSCPASVLRTQECDIFRIHTYQEDGSLQALALAAVQLRVPLSNAMAAVDDLLCSQQLESNQSNQAGQLNKNLFKLMRIISNMSDTDNCNHISKANMQTANLSALINEIAEKAKTLCEGSGIDLQYTGLDTPVFSLAYAEKLERAIYNLLSNALKFAPHGSTVSASLTKNGNQLIFTTTNPTNEQPASNGFWQQYRREPAIEDPRSGLGLGMTLISSVAALHGGTVLIDHPSANEVRVTMTIAINNENSGVVRSPVMRISDYAGGRDKGLMELSEVLPLDAYNKIN